MSGQWQWACHLRCRRRDPAPQPRFAQPIRANRRNAQPGGQGARYPAEDMQSAEPDDLAG
jgi:hypothetical protein